ncbi:MAG: hypothetical protein AB7Y46_00820 [Armatimonadota bacterium]
MTVASGLNQPNGVAWRDRSLYVAEINRFLRVHDIDGRLHDPPEPVVVRGDYRTDRAHGWKFISFGPDGKLYVPVGAPGKACAAGPRAGCRARRPGGGPVDVLVMPDGSLLVPDESMGAV